MGVVFEPATIPKKDGETENEEVNDRIHASRRGRVNGTAVHDDDEDVAGKCLAVVWGANWVARIDLKQLERSQTEENGKYQSKKRSKVGGEGGVLEGKKVDIKVTRKYQPIALLGFVGKGEMIVVERVWADLVTGLPDAWRRNGEFGT